MSFVIRSLSIPDAKLVMWGTHSDDRGYFTEMWNPELSERLGARWCQENVSRSHATVWRGLHYQTGDAAQAKMVRVLSGKILDVIVDMRQSSPTFGKHCTVLIGANTEAQEAIFVPKGFAHGFLAIDESVVSYLVDAPYSPDHEVVLSASDAGCLNLDDATMSDRDAAGVMWDQAPKFP